MDKIRNLVCCDCHSIVVITFSAFTTDGFLIVGGACVVCNDHKLVNARYIVEGVVKRNIVVVEVK